MDFLIHLLFRNTNMANVGILIRKSVQTYLWLIMFGLFNKIHNCFSVPFSVWLCQIGNGRFRPWNRLFLRKTTAKCTHGNNLWTTVTTRHTNSIPIFISKENFWICIYLLNIGPIFKHSESLHVQIQKHSSEWCITYIWVSNSKGFSKSALQ